MGCLAHWGHSPLLGLSLMQKGLFFLLLFFPSPLGGLSRPLSRAVLVEGVSAELLQAAPALACPLLPLKTSLLRSKCLVPPCPHSSGFVSLVITGSKLPLLQLLF